MTGKVSVTVWHNGVPEIFRNVFVKLVSSVDKNGIKQRGFFDSSTCTVRIRCMGPKKFAIGDFMRIGEHTGEAMRGSDFRIMKISDNIRGTTPHYKLVCER